MQYDEQVVLSFIDFPQVKYKGAAITEDNQRDFLNDSSVSEADKTLYKQQYGERCDAENLHDKNVTKSTLVVVGDYVPNTPGQLAKLNAVTSDLLPLGAKSRLYIVGHCDPQTRRLAGLTPNELADALFQTHKFDHVKRIVLVACHGAGEATSADTASLEVTSFAEEFHRILGHQYQILTEVSAYTSYVQISPSGRKRVRFNADTRPESKLDKSKVLFSWFPGPQGGPIPMLEYVYPSFD